MHLLFSWVYLLKRLHNTQRIHFIYQTQLHYWLGITKNSSPLLKYVVYFFIFEWWSQPTEMWTIRLYNRIFSLLIVKGQWKLTQKFFICFICFYQERGVHMHSSECTSLSGVRTDLSLRLLDSKSALQGYWECTWQKSFCFKLLIINQDL